jgi:capsular polysaccharide transport system ATP-binding protein
MHYNTPQGLKVILENVDFVIDWKDRVGLLAPQGGGKSTIINLLAGLERPNSGMLLGRRGDAVLLGNASCLNPAMTGEENIRNVARILGLDGDELVLFCLEFSELGADFYHRLGAYSAGMKARLAFALTLVIPARIYLVDERLTVGDEAMQKKCRAALSRALEDRGLVFLSRSPRLTRDICNIHGVVAGGKIIVCGSHDEAVALFEASADRADDGEVFGDDSLKLNGL